MRERGDGTTINEFIAQIKEKYPDIVLMADISTFEEGIMNANLGADILSTTLSGYTTYSETNSTEPDFELVAKLANAVDIPVILEGRVWTPEEVKKAFDCGAHSVVIGSAVTRPQLITRRFIKALEI